MSLRRIPEGVIPVTNIQAEPPRQPGGAERKEEVNSREPSATWQTEYWECKVGVVVVS